MNHISQMWRYFVTSSQCICGTCGIGWPGSEMMSPYPRTIPTPLNNSLLDLGDQWGRGYICRTGREGGLNLHLTRVNSAGDKVTLISGITA